jgi:hypothetical protein
MCLRTASSSQLVRIAQQKACIKVLCVSAAPACAYASFASPFALEFGTEIVDKCEPFAIIRLLQMVIARGERHLPQQIIS